MSFVDHAKWAPNWAARKTATICRLMPNVGGPKQPRRKLLASVALSVMMYAAPVWATKTDSVATVREALQKAQRGGALAVISAYRTVFSDAAEVLSAMPPPDLVALERTARYRARNNPGAEKIAGREEGYQTMMAAWQERCNRGANGRWTHELISEIGLWVDRMVASGTISGTLKKCGSGRANGAAPK